MTTTTSMTSPGSRTTASADPVASSTSPRAGGGTPSGLPPERPTWRGRRPSLGGRGGRTLALVLAVVAVLALAVPIGLSRLGGGAPSSSEGSTAGGAPGLFQRDAGPATAPEGSDSVAPAPDAPTGSKAGSATVTSDAAAALATTTKIVRTASIGLEVSDLAGAAGRARLIASGAGGTVLSESVVTAADPVGGATSGSEPDGIPQTDGGVTRYGTESSWPSVGLHQARLTISVPADKLDSVLTQLSALGTVSYRSAQAQDVTATYVDTQARIAPARDSITRVRALMAKATDLQQLLVLESELTRRQSDLDALTQQLADLEQRTTMSEVTATMWTPAAATVVEGSGVVGGLNAAWEGLLDSLTLVLTGLAVLLPWLLILGLIAFVTLRVLRRRRAAAPTTP